MTGSAWTQDPAGVEAVLGRNSVLSLGLVDGDVPYVLEMNYGYRLGALYLHCGPAGRKVEILRRNPRVAFFVATDRQLVPATAPCSWTARFRSVMGTGTATILTDRDAVRAGYDILMEHHGAVPGNYREAALGKSVILRIDIESATLRAHGLPRLEEPPEP